MKTQKHPDFLPKVNVAEVEGVKEAQDLRYTQYQNSHR